MTSRRARRTPGAAAALVVLLTLAATAAGAQERFVWTASALGGIGGSIDEDEAGYGNSGYQLGLSLVTDARVRVGVRVGQFELDDTEGFGLLRGPSVDYVVVAGEYRYPESYYESGLFAGLGAYRLDGFLFGQPEEETTAGLALGVNGDFGISRRISVIGELSFHYLLSDYAEFLVTAFAGIGVHF